MYSSNSHHSSVITFDVYNYMALKTAGVFLFTDHMDGYYNTIKQPENFREIKAN